MQSRLNHFQIELVERKIKMKKLLFSTMVVLAVGICSMAAERKALRDVDAESLAADTQVAFKGAGDNHVAFAWWMPNEYWESFLSRDTSMSEDDKRAMLDTMSGVCLFAVAQADISAFGSFDFYSKGLIESNMVISFSDANGTRQRLLPLQEIDPDLQILLDVIRPILASAMGNFGNNMHFYVLNDRSKTSSRLLDPYRKGKINIQLSRRDGARLTADIEMPVNALFVPRKCPNGKDAHISWNYCPWTGERLED